MGEIVQRIHLEDRSQVLVYARTRKLEMKYAPYTDTKEFERFQNRPNFRSKRHRLSTVLFTAPLAHRGPGFNFGRFSSNSFDRRLDSGSPQAPPGMTVLVGRRYPPIALCHVTSPHPTFRGRGRPGTSRAVAVPSSAYTSWRSGRVSFFFWDSSCRRTRKSLHT